MLRPPPPESPAAHKTPGGRFYVRARLLQQPPSATANNVSSAPLEPHAYQLDNSVVPFPTCKGKTLVAVLLASRCLADKRGAVVVESRDLADQQCAVLRRDLPATTRVGLARGGENLSINSAKQGVHPCASAARRAHRGRSLRPLWRLPPRQRLRPSAPLWHL